MKKNLKKMLWKKIKSFLLLLLLLFFVVVVVVVVFALAYYKMTRGIGTMRLYPVYI
jgi:uncharacterized membrane protein